VGPPPQIAACAGRRVSWSPPLFLAQLHIICAAAPVARMGRLEACNMLAELAFMEPVRHQTAQSALALGRWKMTGTMQRVAGEGRSALAGDHQHQAQAMSSRCHQEVEQTLAR